jgi:hypothetical protein
VSGAVHILFIPGWRPAPLNKIMHGHWSNGNRLKKADFGMITAYAMASRIPKATGRRRVELHITLTGQQKQADPDAYAKSTLDGLKRCGLLVDDSGAWVEWVTPTYDRCGEPGTRITLTDLL